MDNFENYATITSPALTKQAEICYEQQMYEESYKLARQASTFDAFDKQALIIYIASATELNLKSELYYIGHELTSFSPKSAISWYAVGSYYFCCKNFEMAQKFYSKCTKLDKRFAQGWVSFGHCLALQEESEHALSAYRTAARLMPGDYRPMLYMAKELVNNLINLIRLILKLII